MTFYRLSLRNYYHYRSGIPLTSIPLTYCDITLFTVDSPSHLLHTSQVIPIATPNRQDFINQSIPYIASLPVQLKSFREFLQYIFTHPTE